MISPAETVDVIIKITITVAMIDTLILHLPYVVDMQE